MAYFSSVRKGIFSSAKLIGTKRTAAGLPCINGTKSTRHGFSLFRYNFTRVFTLPKSNRQQMLSTSCYTTST